MSDILQNTPLKHIWSGVYPTWTEAVRSAKNLGSDGLSSEKWFERISSQLLSYRDESNLYGNAPPPRASNLPLVCSLTNPSAIVDFGGSSGWCWDYLKNTQADNRITSYCIVETDEVVDLMRQLDLHAEPVIYKSFKDHLVSACDLLYANSVLQYVDSNLPLLNLIKSTNPQFILLDDLVAKGECDIFTVQNFHNSGIAYRFIGLNNLLNDLNLAGYTELMRMPYPSTTLGIMQPYDMSNLPIEMRLRYSLSIIFKKNKK